MPKNKLIEIFYRAATGSRRTRTFLTPVGPLFFLGFVALLVYASLRVDRWLGLLPAPIDVVVALPLLGAGLFMVLWSVGNFLRVRGTPVPFNPPPVVVDTGPYAYVRNPMLTGLFSVLFGLGVLLPSVSLVFVFTPLFILLNVWELKAVEEPELEKRLGENYIEYKKKVPMFFPRIKRN